MKHAVTALCVLAGLALLAQTQGPVTPRQPKPPPPPKDEVPIGQPAQKPDEKAAASADAPKEPICVSDSEDPGRPVLRRGKSERASRPRCEELATPISGRTPSDADAEPGTEPRATSAARNDGAEEKEPGADPDAPLTLIDKVRMRAGEFSTSLPNFICEQLIRRSTSGNSGKSWKLQDTVLVEVMLVDGKEDYRNARRNNKPVEWEKVKDTGTWSAGEYGTVLRDILHPATRAEFKKRGEDRIGGQSLEVHDYVVQKENSHWTIAFGGRPVRPKYRGAIWIDTKENMVRRIEMEALNMPADYAIRHVEMTLEFGPVKIGNEWYILPTRTENLACGAGSSNCSKNETDFRNYRKFSTESTISTTDSTVTFEGDEKPPLKKK
jgi:hypothetical protein